MNVNFIGFIVCFTWINCFLNKPAECFSSELATAITNASLGRADFDLVVQAWNKYRDEVKIDLDLLTSGLASQLDQIIIKSNVSRRCSQGLKYLFDQSENKKTWALQGKLLIFFIEITLYYYGNN